MPAPRVLVIDDDEQDRATVRMHLEDAGLDVLAPPQSYTHVSELVNFVVGASVDVTICDHRLQPGGLAPFFGAEAVASLVQAEQVAVLVTSYIDSDFDTTIRLHRRRIPAVLSRSELEEPDALEALVDVVRAEMEGRISPERQLHETILRVGDVVGSGEELALDVFVDGWRPDKAVRVPAGLLTSDLIDLGTALRGRFLVAEVNTSAKRGDEVYFGRIDGPTEPADWPVSEVGQGTDFPLRTDTDRG